MTREIPSAQVWFAGGERIGYDAGARAIVRGPGAPLSVFLKCEGDLAHAVSFLPGFPDGSFGWAKVLSFLRGQICIKLTRLCDHRGGSIRAIGRLSRAENRLTYGDPPANQGVTPSLLKVTAKAKGSPDEAADAFVSDRNQSNHSFNGII